MEPILLLWDIDGTLLTQDGAGQIAFEKSFFDYTGKNLSIESLDYAGRTDIRIAKLFLEAENLPVTNDAVKKLTEQYVAYLPESLKQTNGRVLEGVSEIIEVVTENPSVHNGLLTGNLIKGASAKLSHFGLDSYFAFGGFADYNEDRNILAEIAFKNAVFSTKVSFELSRTYVVGDTPHDIECGKAIGAKTVAVSTGKYSFKDLSNLNPDYCLASLKETKEFLQIIGLDCEK